LSPARSAISVRGFGQTPKSFVRHRLIDAKIRAAYRRATIWERRLSCWPHRLRLRVERKLQSVSLGLTDIEPIKTSGKTDLAAAVKEYLSDTAKAKPKRTLRKTFRNDAS
jgi:hypothetical protein